MHSKKRKDAVVFGAGVVLVAALVAFLFISLGGGSPASSTSTTGQATTTTPSSASKPSGTAVAADRSVNGVLAGVSGTSIFRSLLLSTGVGATLTGSSYTVFVPTDAAFGLLPKNTLSNMSAAQKKRLVQHHIVAGKGLDIDAISSGTHMALSKEMLNFNVNLSTMAVYVNSAKSVSQYKAQNAIIYTLNTVLIPPQTANPSTGSTGSVTP